MGYKVMQIEVSNLCSLTCVYCPHPTQVRPKGNMSMDNFKKCIELVKRSDNPQLCGKKFVYLNHFGEPLLNPLLPEFIAYSVSQNIEVSLASNGVDYDKNLFPQELWRTLAAAGLKHVMISSHVKSAMSLRKHIGDIIDHVVVWQPKRQNLHNWAGQVNMEKFKLVDRPIPESPCDYEIHDMFAITWDGKLAACCYDIEGSVSLSIDDVLNAGFKFRRISLCSNCRLGRGDVDWLLGPFTQILQPQLSNREDNKSQASQ